MARTSGSEIPGFIFCFLVSIILVVLSFNNIYREYNAESRDKFKEFTYTRWLIVAISILTFIVFLGYFLSSEVLMQLGWTLWIPLAVLSMTVLSIRMITTYSNMVTMSTRSLIKNYNQKYCADKCSLLFVGHIFIFIIALLDFAGTIIGAILSFDGNIRWQILCYALWKVFAFICLISLDILIFLVWKKCYNKLPSVPQNSSAHKNIKTAIIKLGILMIFMLILAITIITQGISELISFAANTDYDFVQEPMWRLIVIYLPIWSSITIINLSYSWIPKHKLAETNKERVVSVTETNNMNNESV